MSKDCAWQRLGFLGRIPVWIVHQDGTQRLIDSWIRASEERLLHPLAKVQGGKGGAVSRAMNWQPPTFFFVSSLRYKFSTKLHYFSDFLGKASGLAMWWCPGFTVQYMSMHGVGNPYRQTPGSDGADLLLLGFGGRFRIWERRRSLRIARWLAFEEVPKVCASFAKQAVGFSRRNSSWRRPPTFLSAMSRGQSDPGILDQIFLFM